MNHWRTLAASLLLAVALGGSLSAQPATIVVPANQALLGVRVPTADALLSIEGWTSAQRGTERLYFTPVITPGQSYSYVMKLTWQENGVAKSEVRTVDFAAGDTATVDFRLPQAEKVSTPIVKVKPNDGGSIPKKPANVKERTFLFTYAGAVKELKPGKEARVWLPVAVSGPEQTIKIVTQNVPGKATIASEKQYGNTSLYFQAKANDKGEIPFEVVYRVTRKEVKTDVSANLTLKPAESENLTRFLEADALVPISGKPLELVKDKKLPSDQFAAAKVLYEVVNTHMKYSKEGKGWGKGDSVWACDSKFGNCSDFHSLFISMARGNKIPSKFEMGFPIPTKHGEGVVGGYHCWAWFFPDKKGWIPVDISEANRNPELRDYYFGNLTEDRVRFTTGRDINLEPRQAAGPLNFFIYPYVEVNGKTHPQEKIDRRFAYKDVQ